MMFTDRGYALSVDDKIDADEWAKMIDLVDDRAVLS
jgi:hypothetical protein